MNTNSIFVFLEFRLETGGRRRNFAVIRVIKVPGTQFVARQPRTIRSTIFVAATEYVPPRTQTAAGHWQTAQDYLATG